MPEQTNRSRPRPEGTYAQGRPAQARPAQGRPVAGPPQSRPPQSRPAAPRPQAMPPRSGRPAPGKHVQGRPQRPTGGGGNGPKGPRSNGGGPRKPLNRKALIRNIITAAAILVLGAAAFGFMYFFSDIKGGLINLVKPTASATASPAPTAAMEATPQPTQTAAAEETVEPTATPDPTAEPTPTPPATQEITISAVGDIMAHEPELTAAYEKSSGEYNFFPFFSQIKDAVSRADIAIGNLETTLSGKDKKYTGYPAFNSPESLLPALKDAGFDVLTTANNHIFDRGYAGVESTIKFLNEQGIPNTGTYLSAEDYNKPLIVEAKGLKVAVLAYSYGENRAGAIPAEQLRYVIKNINLETVKKDVAKSREMGADIVLVSLHWGAEYSRTPSAKMKSQAEEMFKAGVDVIVGSHPHVLQTIERMKVTRDDGSDYEGIVAYSMGNFVSNQDPKYRDAGMIFNVTMEKDSATGKVRIKDATYLPTCTYKITGQVYKVLPVGKFIDDAGLMKKVVASSKQGRVKAVWKETTDLIGSEAATPVRE